MPNPKIALNALQKGHDALTNQNHAEAITQYTIAAHLGNHEAKNTLGYFKFIDAKTAKEDQQTGENYRTAFAYFLEAAQGGDPEGCYRTGGCFDKGFGTAIDPARAIFYHTRAATMGHPFGIQRVNEFLAKKSAEIIKELTTGNEPQSKQLEVLMIGIVNDEDYLAQQINCFIYQNILRAIQNNLAGQLVRLLDIKDKKIGVADIDKLFKPLKVICMLNPGVGAQAKNHLGRMSDKLSVQSLQAFRANLATVLKKDQQKIEQTLAFLLARLKDCHSYSESTTIQFEVAKTAAQSAILFTALVDYRDRTFGLRANAQLFESLALALGMEYEQKTLEILTDIEGVLYNNDTMFYHGAYKVLSATTFIDRKQLHDTSTQIVNALKNPAHAKMSKYGYQKVLAKCLEVVFAIEYHDAYKAPSLILAILSLTKEEFDNDTQWTQVFSKLMAGVLKEPFRFISETGEIDIIEKASKWFLRSIFDEKIGIQLKPEEIDFLDKNENKILTFIERFCHEFLTKEIKKTDTELLAGQKALAENNYLEAEKCFTVVANRGNFAGHYYLGIIAQHHASSLNENQLKGENYTLAFQYFSEAVLSSYGPAFYQAGQCYEKGMGTEKNISTATFLYMQGETYEVKEAAEAADVLVLKFAQEILTNIKQKPVNIEQTILKMLEGRNINTDEYLSRQYDLLVKVRIVNAMLLLLKDELSQTDPANHMLDAVEILLSAKVKIFDISTSAEEHKQIKYNLFLLARNDHHKEVDEFEEGVSALFPAGLTEIEVRRIIEDVCVRLMNSLKKCDKSNLQSRAQVSLSLIQLLTYRDQKYGFDLRQHFFRTFLLKMVKIEVLDVVLPIFDELESVRLNKSNSCYQHICRTLETLNQKQNESLFHILIFLSLTGGEMQKIASYFLLAMVRFDYAKTKTMPLLVQELVKIPEEVYADETKWPNIIQVLYEKFLAEGHFVSHAKTIELTGYATWFVATQQNYFPEVAQEHQLLITRNADRMVKFIDVFVELSNKKINEASASSSTQNGLGYMQQMSVSIVGNAAAQKTPVMTYTLNKTK